MARIAVFASGNGTNFEALAEKFLNDKENQIVLLICDKEKAFVLERAKKFNIKYELVKYDKNDRLKAEKDIINLIKKYEIEIIFLAGFMRILTSIILNEIKIPIINIHPSILPAHKGVGAIEKAYNEGDAETGISIHYVNEELDGGELILQKRIPLSKDKDLEYVENEVHKLEHKWYPFVAKELCDKLNKSK